MNELLPIVMEVGRFNLTCMELLDRANTETFGDPVPVSVSLTVEKGPFIVVVMGAAISSLPKKYSLGTLKALSSFG